MLDADGASQADQAIRVPSREIASAGADASNAVPGAAATEKRVVIVGSPRLERVSCQIAAAAMHSVTAATPQGTSSLPIDGDTRTASAASAGGWAATEGGGAAGLTGATNR